MTTSSNTIDIASTSSQSGDLPCITLVHGPTSASVDVLYYGATVVCYKPTAECPNTLFVSPCTHTDKRKPIRGGIPVVFPIFGAGDMSQDTSTCVPAVASTMPSHGFARRHDWILKSMDLTIPSVSLVLTSNASTRQLWPVDFTLTLVVSLTTTGQCVTALQIENPSSTTSFTCQALFHSYLSIPSLSRASVRGLTGLASIEKAALGGLRKNQADPRETITFDQEVDDIFINAPTQTMLYVDERSWLSVTTTTMMSSPSSSDSSSPQMDVVVWNPGQNKAALMEDLEEYQTFVCIEPGVVSRYVTVGPMEVWTLTQTLEKES